MKSLTQKALRVFTVIEELRQGSIDILDSILPFFEPILFEMNADIFDPITFSENVKRLYKWNFTSDIAEELIPRFLSRGWLAKEVTAECGTAYRVTYENANAAPPTEREIQVSEKLDRITKDFQRFISTLSPLTAYDRSPDELADVLVEWLVSIDAYNEDILREEAVKRNTTETLSVYQELPDGTNLSTEDRYLCARYVKNLFDTSSDYTKDLVRIAAVGLLTEVVQDFYKPVTHVNKSKLKIYLDGPVALDLLGVSGKSALDNIKPLIQNAQAIGCQIRIFDVTLQEMSRALESMLKRRSPDRTGPTAAALRRRETTEQYVRAVANDPETFLKRPFGNRIPLGSDL